MMPSAPWRPGADGYRGPVAARIGVDTYLLGMTGLLGATAALAWGSVAVRAVVVPTWHGARARLAEVTVFLATALGVAQLAGAVFLLRAPIVFVAEVAAGLGLVAGARWWAGRHPVAEPAAAPSSPPSAVDPGPMTVRRKVEWALAAVSVGIVGTQWLAHTADAVQRGMPHPDTHWYHGPFVARFIQTGGFPDLAGLGHSPSQWFPFDSHLAQALVVMPFHRDWLAPALNMGWFALALLAAWVVGERRGAGPMALSVTAVGLGLPIMAATQPGQMSTDIPCAALFLAAVALLLESDLRPGPLALAGAATGLGVSTKVTIAVPVAAMAAVVALVLVARRRWPALAAWSGSIALTGTFWYVRNWIISGNPLPWFEVPFLFDQVVISEGDDLALATATYSRQEWDAVYHPGLEQGFGPAWPVPILLLLVGLVVGLRGRGLTEKLAGLVLAAGIVGYVVSPVTAGVGFVFSLRYIGAPILLAGAVLPLVLPARPAVRLATGIAAVPLVVAGATATHEERTPAWPDATPVAVAAAVLGVLVVAAAVLAVRRGLVRPVALAAVGAVAVVAVGWPVQRYSTDHRYVAAGLPTSDVVSAAMRDVSGADVVVYGTAEAYPMMGVDLSNEVVLGATPPPGETWTCRRWREELGGRYDYVAVVTFGLLPLPRPADADLATDPAVTVVVRDGESALYRLSGPLDPTLCP